MIEKGDIVNRRSYNGDLLFTVKQINENNNVALSCLSYRLKADAPASDLTLVKRDSVFNFKKIFRTEVDKKIEDIVKGRRETKEKGFYFPGKVLHVDADEGYLSMCLTYYNQLGIQADGIFIEESRQPLAIMELLKVSMPDILVLTGHDSIRKNGNEGEIRDYTNSIFFVEAVKKARQFQSDKDSLIIFAGACQSHYKDIINAGANFASSPERVLIHALDPVFIAEKIAYTPVDRFLTVDECMENTITGLGGLGGIETRGALRMGKPFLK